MPFNPVRGPVHIAGTVTLLNRLMMVLIMVLAVPGCTSGPSPVPTGQPVSLSAFSRPVEDSDQTGAKTNPGEAQLIATGPQGNVEPTPIIFPLEARDSAAERAQEAARAADSRPILVESLVGQINGRAIYADKFFEPVEDQIVSKTRTATTTRQFAQTASPIIHKHLEQVVLNHLFLAEAQSNLTVDQRKGLSHFLKQIQQQTISRADGSQTKANQELQEREGITIDEYAQNVLDEHLIKQLWTEQIESRVIVSWRDIEREYRRRYNEFNPNSVVNLSRIRVSNGKAEQVEEVKSRLAEGEPFSDIATAVNMADEGAWQSFPFGAKGLSSVDLRDSIRVHIESLDVGQTSEPFTVGSSTWWLHIASIDRPDGIDLYDPMLQRQLADQIRSRRRSEEQLRFIDSLLEGGIYDELQTMSDRLLALAVLRYGP